MPSALHLSELRHEAHAALVAAERPLTAQDLARRLFGSRRHEDPVAALVVRFLLQSDPRFVRTHAGRWSVSGAAYLARPLAATDFVVVDLETTGSVLGVDEVVEIGALRLHGGEVTGRFATLVRPERPLPLWVRRLTGIRTADLRDAPTFPEVAGELTELLSGAIFVAHDLRFDLPFLRWEFSRHGLVMPDAIGVCTLQLSRVLWPDLPSRRLGELAQHFGVVHSRPHRAAADAEATAGVFLRALAAAGEIGLVDLGDLFSGSLPEAATEVPPLAARAAG